MWRSSLYQCKKPYLLFDYSWNFPRIFRILRVKQMPEKMSAFAGSVLLDMS